MRGSAAAGKKRVASVRKLAGEVRAKSQFGFPRVSLTFPRDITHSPRPPSFQPAEYPRSNLVNSDPEGKSSVLRAPPRFESHERSHFRKSHITRRFLDRLFSPFVSALARMFLEFSNMGENRATALQLIIVTRRYFSLSMFSGATFICPVNRVPNSRSTLLHKNERHDSRRHDQITASMGTVSS